MEEKKKTNEKEVAMVECPFCNKPIEAPAKELKGKDKFTQEEIKELERLIRLRCNAQSKGEQKKLRDAMRAIKFYGRDDWGISNMTIEKFHNLLRDKLITCTDDIQD